MKMFGASSKYPFIVDATFALSTDEKIIFCFVEGQSENPTITQCT